MHSVLYIPGQFSGPILTQRTGVVMQLLDKQAPTEAQIQQNLDAVRDQLIQQRRDAAFAVFVTSLQEHYTQRGLIRYNKKTPAPVVPGM